MKSIRPASILFISLTFILSFIACTAIAGLLGAGKNQGLAAAAIVLGYGLMGAVVLTFFAGLMAMKLKTQKIIQMNKIGGVLIFFFAIYVVIRLVFFSENQPASPKPETTKPTTQSISLFNIAENESGLGFFKPNIYQLQTLYFYGNITPGKSLYESVPYDSVTFVQNELDQYNISYAPPILNPAHIKMDYEILMFRIIRLAREFAEIMVSEQTGHTAIVDLQSGSVVLWPEFLLGVSSIEMEHPDIRIKPLDHASGLTVSNTVSYYKPLSIKNNWIEVACTDQNLKELGRGWIKWTDGNRLLVRYSLLS